MSYHNNRPGTNLRFNNWEDIWSHTLNPFCSPEVYEGALNNFFSNHDSVTCPSNWNESQEVITILKGYSYLFSLKSINHNLANLPSDSRSTYFLEEINNIFFRGTGSISNSVNIFHDLNRILSNLNNIFSNQNEPSFDLTDRIDEIVSDLNKKFDKLKTKSIKSNSNTFFDDFLVWVHNPLPGTLDFSLEMTHLISSLANIFLVQQHANIPPDIASIL